MGRLLINFGTLVFEQGGEYLDFYLDEIMNPNVGSHIN